MVLTTVSLHSYNVIKRWRMYLISCTELFTFTHINNQSKEICYQQKLSLVKLRGMSAHLRVVVSYSHIPIYSSATSTRSYNNLLHSLFPVKGGFWIGLQQYYQFY